MTVLETARLTLRPPVDADAPRLAALSSDLRVARMVSRIPHPDTEAQVLDFLAGARAAGAVVFAVDDGEAIGMAGLEKGEPGYWIAPAAWGRGCATEAAGALLAHGFGALGMDRVRAQVFADNPASARVLAKLGFRPVGRTTARSLAREAEVEAVELVLDRTDWEAAR
mgnify:CR=1 FL=1